MSASPVSGPTSIPPVAERSLQAVESQRIRADNDPHDGRLREAFNAFVGQTFYGQMLAAMRKTVGESAYFHGGSAERIFQGQLDQVLAERMSEASADTFTGPMFDLFMLRRP